MNAFYLQAASYLPQPLRRAAERVEPAVQERVHELRLRRGRPRTDEGKIIHVLPPLRRGAGRCAR